MEYAIEMLHITKEFPGIIANDDVTLQVREGEIHALLGENGAGKSTLMSVLFGLYKPEKGEIKLRGNSVRIAGPREANNLGIGMVHQHFKLVRNFTVLENIVLGVETVNGAFLQMEDAREKVVALSEQYGLKVDPDARIQDISVGMQQRVEILKMLYRDNDILIFDEPTAVLTPQEIDELMKIMKGLSKEGKTIVFITHKLNEIKQVADRCTVLRRGKLVGTVEVASTTVEQMSEMMVGRKVNFKVEKAPQQMGDVVLQVEGLNVLSRQQKRQVLKNVNFQLHKGEILCIAGIEGNGQTELAEALAGLRPVESGKVFLKGEDITAQSVRYRNTHGMSHIPEDRHRYGLVLDYTLAENLVLKKYFEPAFQKGGFLDFAKMNAYGEQLIDQYDIRSSRRTKTLVRSMSGGNQQKAIVAREVDLNQDLLIAVQPSRGLDVGAVEYIHKQLVAQRDSGKGVLLISLELDEVMDVSDRILVMYEGEIVADVNPKEITVQELGLYMAGSKRKEVV